MTFKDLIRLLRRRWLTAGLVFAAVFIGFMGFSAVTERPLFRARARVLITTPPVLLTATQGSQWISVTQMDPKTWISIISSAQIRRLSEAALRKEFPQYDVQPEWLNSVGATLESDGQLAWIEAVGPNPEIAANVANVVARQVEEYSREIAGRDLNEARVRTTDRLRKERDTQLGEESNAKKVRDDARARYGAENLDLDVRKLEEETVSHDSHRRDLERRQATNRLRLERIKADRSVAEHLQREGVFRLATASGESRVQDSPLVKQVSERLETLHRELLTALRRYTEEHPLVKNLRSDIRQTELDLTRARIQALGSDIDREELALRTDNELITIEIRVLEPEVRELRDRLALLSPMLDDVKVKERAAQDARGRAATVETLLAQLSAAPDAGYVRRLDPDSAKPEEAVRIEMRLRKSWPVALLASAIVGISFAFLREFVDTSLRTDYDVRRHLDYPVLAVAPRVAAGEILTVRAVRASIMSEIYDTLATVLLSTPSDRPSRVFMVTSTNPQEGKTVTSINLSVAFARQGKRTLLIDGDMRVPSVHTSLTLPSSPGLSEVLAGTVQPTDEGVLQGTEVPNLSVLPCGVQPESPYELLDPSRLGPMTAQLREMFDVIVFDTPPVLRTGDALKISTVAEQTLFVVEAGRTEQRQAAWAKRLLANVGTRIAGAVLNRAVTETEEYYYYYGSATGQSRKEARAR
ncbi:MAG: polysaccharide biosynthesis tyrosine autokinase [Planctomycetaceae bacterium]|nr:polysaccharide biosynthesis tyrosine autokinase [Planctomycetaceae bacterium]